MEKFDTAGHMAHYSSNTNPSGLSETEDGRIQAFYEAPLVEVDLTRAGRVLSEGTIARFSIGFQWDAFW
jgi:hypothetical protein